MRLTRPPAQGERGMVATPHHLASVAALDVLREGGSAVDAAVCAAATLGVVLPHMTGLGGDAFWMIHTPGARAPLAINGSGPCGASIGLADFAGRSEIPARGPRAAITVPGGVDSWRLAHARAGRLPLARLLEPAIGYARDGFAVSSDLARWTADSSAALRDDPGASALFLPNGRPLRAGERLVQAALAKTLADIATGGPRHYYEATAASIVGYLLARGGLLTTGDFAGYAASEVEPISVAYRDCRAWQLPPPSQGVAGLLILSFLDGIDLRRAGDGSAEYFHALIQAIKWSFRKRDACLCDPRFGDVPVARLLDPALAAAERGEWLADPALQQRSRRSGSDTVFIATADADGNAVGLVHSLYFDFGAAVLDPGSGVLLQNRGSFFSLDPGHPNVLAPGKQTASTLMSGMVYRDGAPYLVHGTQGGEVQPQTNTSIVTRVLDFGLDVQQAIEAPRVLHGRSWGDAADQLLIESSVPPGVVEALRERGHPAEAAGWPHPRMGTAQAIRLKGAWGEFLEGGADPRGEGLALGF
ncbi:MAG: gamma-glutamyltransferase [Candidatus Levyibacteriota bacterium]